MRLGERLHELRRGAGVTLLQVAQATSLSVSYLSDLERGRTTPSIDTLERIAGYYGMPIGELVAGVDGWTVEPTQQLAPGLEELVRADKIDLRTAQDLSRIELRGRRPQTPEEWEEIYLHLKTLMRPYLPSSEDAKDIK